MCGSIVVLLLASVAGALPYEEEAGSTRYRFAQSYLGVEYEVVAGGGRLPRLVAGSLDGVAFPSRGVPLLTLGGHHFWGHADFYVSFALGQQPLGTSPVPHGIGEILTGGRWFPWRVTTGAIRPFAGGAWAPVSYLQQVGDASGP